MQDLEAVAATAYPSITCGDVARSVADCFERSGRLAGALRERGLSLGTTVGVLAYNSIEFLEISLAIGAAGGNPVPINWHWTPAEVAYLLSDSGVRILFCDTALLSTARSAVTTLDYEIEIIEIARPGDGTGVTHEDLIAGAGEALGHREGALAASLGLIYTSGTTGRPKGVLRELMSAEQLLSVAGATAARMGLRDNGRMMIAGPLYHTSPNAMALLALRMGSNVTIMPRWDAEEFLRLVERDRIEQVKVVPTMLSRLLSLPDEVRNRYDVSSMTHLIHSAAPCPPAIKRAIIDWFGDAVLEFYGCTEAGTVTWISAAEWEARPGSVGRPADGSSVRIVDNAGRVVPPGVDGHVQVIAPDYWPTFTYLHHIAVTAFPLDVGDLGHVDDDGYLFLTGRSSEVIISGGVNIYPAEIEAAAMELPYVEDAAAVGRPHEGDLGEQVALYVVARPGMAVHPLELLDALSDRLAPYKLPRVIEVLDQLPRDENGKVYKSRL